MRSGARAGLEVKGNAMGSKDWRDQVPRCGAMVPFEEGQCAHAANTTAAR